ncbi:MAG: RNA 2',3'-cyclic phosphodiesterase [Thermoplasmata archaeon]
MRAFVAIDLPPLEGPTPPGLRPEDHLTLRFFEELPADRVPVVVDALAEAAGESGPFQLEVCGVGAFPTPQRPRVVWAGVGSGSTAPLQTLAERLGRALAARGFPADRRPFVPHLTLARIRSARDLAWASRFLADPENATRIWTRTIVSEILLKEGVLLPTGARHTVLERRALGRSA